MAQLVAYLVWDQVVPRSSRGTPTEMITATIIKWAVIFIVTVLFVYLVWKAFIHNGKKDLKRYEERNGELQEEILRLKDTVQQLDRQLSEVTRSKLNVSSLTPILHVSVLNIDTNFVRTYIRDEGKMTFEGALRADICAEYGIRLEEVKFRYDHLNNTLFLADFHPGIISYSRKQLEWDIARSFRSRRFLGHSFARKSDDSTEAFTKRMCESLRVSLEKEIDSRSISEFDWLAPFISRQVVDLIKLSVRIPGLKVAVSEKAEGDFVDFETFQKQIAQ